MTQPRGNKNSGAEIEARRTLLRANPSPAASTAPHDGSPATTPPVRAPETEPGTAA